MLKARINGAQQIGIQLLGPVHPGRTLAEQIAPADRRPGKDDYYPDLEQISLIAVRSRSHIKTFNLPEIANFCLITCSLL
jgi:hypothetical protein